MLNRALNYAEAYFLLATLLLVSLCFFLVQQVHAAAPDDIKTNQRVWFDAYDINGDNNFTNNPANGSSIATWTDKSPTAQNVTQGAASRQPAMQTAAPYGVKFDSSDNLIDNDDIWAGNVTDADIFIVSAVRVKNRSLLFSSENTARTFKRLSANVPWLPGNSANGVYWDKGEDYRNVGRVVDSDVSFSVNQPYLWGFYGASTGTNDPFGDSSQRMRIIRDGLNRAASTTGDSFDKPPLFGILSANRFALGADGVNSQNFYDGVISEAIFYERILKLAERHILQSYMAARWNTLSLNNDKYLGDDSAKGNYDFHVGGIGRESTGNQNTGTSLGLTLTNQGFLSANNTYLLAGLDNLTPSTGVSTTNLPTNFSGRRAQRIWYFDVTTGTGGVKLDFNLSQLGITTGNLTMPVLLYRAGNSGNFSALSTGTTTGTGANVVTSFNNVSNLIDGYYTIGFRDLPSFNVKKTARVFSNTVTGTNNPKAIPGAQLIYDVTITNQATGSSDQDSLIVSDTFDNKLDLLFNNFGGGGSPVRLTQGLPRSCNLTLDYQSLASTTDDLEFLNAGGTPFTPNPVNNIDPNVRGIRIIPSGIFAAATSTQNASCVLSFPMRIR